MAANVYDQTARYAARLDPPGFLAWALGVPAADLGFGGWLDTRGVAFPGDPDRTGDTVARLDPPANPGPPWLVAVEFQTAPDPGMFGRLLAYLGGAWSALRPDPERGSRFEVGAVVVNLTGTGSASRKMRWPAAGLATDLGVAERNLAGENADITLARVEAGHLSPCVLPWVALMAGGADPAVIDRWKRLASAEPDDRMRSDYGALAKVFANAAGRRDEWAKGLEGWNVTESAVVNEWIQSGIDKGLQQGLQQGRQEGLQQGRQEGRREERAALLAAVLAERFGPISADLAVAIDRTTDPDRLRGWVGHAVRAESLAAFRAAAGI